MVVINWWSSLMRKIPRWAKLILAIGVIVSLIYSTIDVVAQVVSIPATVENHERWINNTEPLLKFLVCRSIERDAGRLTGACTFLLRDSDLYEEFVGLGLINQGAN